MPSDSRKNTPKRARHDAVRPPQESAVTGGSSSTTPGDDVEMRQTVGEGPLEPGGNDDM